jgi:hypothetical protein
MQLMAQGRKKKAPAKQQVRLSSRVLSGPNGASDAVLLPRQPTSMVEPVNKLRLLHAVALQDNAQPEALDAQPEAVQRLYAAVVELRGEDVAKKASATAVDSRRHGLSNMLLCRPCLILIISWHKDMRTKKTFKNLRWPL